MSAPRRTAGDRVRRLALADAAAAPALHCAPSLHWPRRPHGRRAALLASLSQPCDGGGER